MAETYELDGRGRSVIIKDPSAILDYTFDWSEYLIEIDDTLALVEFIVDVENGLTKESSSFTATTATVWVGGGTLDKIASVTCRITTTKSRVDDRSIYLKIKQR